MEVKDLALAPSMVLQTTDRDSGLCLSAKQVESVASGLNAHHIGVEEARERALPHHEYQC